MWKKDSAKGTELEGVKSEVIKEKLIKLGLSSLGRMKNDIVERLLRAKAEKARKAAKDEEREMPRKKKSKKREEVTGGIDPAVELQREILPLIFSFLDLPSIASAARVSKAWREAAEWGELWEAMFTKYSLPVHVPRTDFPSTKMWFACHWVASGFHRPLGDSLVKSDDLLRSRLESGNRRRCRYCKYAVPANSWVTMIDCGSMSWSTVHLACYLRRNALSLSKMDFRFPDLGEKATPDLYVRIALWVFTGFPADNVPPNIGIRVPSWKK